MTRIDPANVEQFYLAINQIAQQHNVTRHTLDSHEARDRFLRLVEEHYGITIHFDSDMMGSYVLPYFSIESNPKSTLFIIRCS